jgi:hypothetical protein
MKKEKKSLGRSIWRNSLLAFPLRKLADVIAFRKFKEASIASHSLRFGGNVAGNVDRCDAQVVRGWVYDVTRPNKLLDVDILVNGKKVHGISANVYRSDIAALLEDHGVHGFECTFDALGVPSSGERLVTIRLADRPRYVLGSFEISVMNVFAAFPTIGISQALDDRLSHIFNHITAAHEDGLGRFDKIQAMIGELQSVLKDQGLSRSSASSHVDALLYDMPLTAITGVGQFRAPNSFAEEAALFQARLEQALLKARYTASTSE